MASAVPNTQPIYPNRPFTWYCRLTTQVCGRDPSNTTEVGPPILLGRAGKAGCIVDSLQFVSVVSPVSGGSGSSSGGPVNPSTGPNADDADIGSFGWGTTGHEKGVNFYAKNEGSDQLCWIGIVGLPTDSPAKSLHTSFLDEINLKILFSLMDWVEEHSR